MHSTNVEELRNKYRCEKHNRYCLVSGSDLKTGQHQEMDDIALSHWARKMVSICGTRALPISTDEELD